jgi:hypothetical protein
MYRFWRSALVTRAPAVNSIKTLDESLCSSSESSIRPRRVPARVPHAILQKSPLTGINGKFTVCASRSAKPLCVRVRMRACVDFLGYAGTHGTSLLFLYFLLIHQGETAQSMYQRANRAGAFPPAREL